MFENAMLSAVAAEENKLENKNPSIKKLVISHCVKARLIDDKEIEERSDSYLWLCKVCNTYLISMDIHDLLEEEDLIPLSPSDVIMEEKMKAKTILEQIAKRIVATIPPYKVTKSIKTEEKANKLSI
ncbi:hypothetical protein [Photobacterium sanguinicancri]|uniref:DUF4145 domain-containing protein n=1 Tax=Photobacterium sanguinicancri TaxID=875932 RepID=A0AAW7Y842_9GAMM|nr:hypothetical protein [Photobacterium sanguinicancri]MDO6543689.1 hypothetical protein [Photobacterium sanguinicancri]